MIDLSAILEQHQRAESLARRKLHPAIRVIGFDEADQEAAALCEAIDDAATETARTRVINFCTKASPIAGRMEW